MTQIKPFFYNPDGRIFHGVWGVDRGFTYGDFRNLKTDDEKFIHFKERLDGLYINGVKDITHPFSKAVMTCIGCDVLGQVFFGFDSSKNHSITENTIKIFEELDPTNLRRGIELEFRNNYEGRLNIRSPLKPTWHYSHVFNHGLRNSYIHSFRPFGIILNDTLNSFIEIKNEEGCIVVNPDKFWEAFYVFYQTKFDELINDHSSPYRISAKIYLESFV
jgi:hypothetical protein